LGALQVGKRVSKGSSQHLAENGQLPISHSPGWACLVACQTGVPPWATPDSLTGVFSLSLCKFTASSKHPVRTGGGESRVAPVNKEAAVGVHMRN
jgi:hypothetical protein